VAQIKVPAAHYPPTVSLPSGYRVTAPDMVNGVAAASAQVRQRTSMQPNEFHHELLRWCLHLPVSAFWTTTRDFLSVLQLSPTPLSVAGSIDRVGNRRKSTRASAPGLLAHDQHRRNTVQQTVASPPCHASLFCSSVKSIVPAAKWYVLGTGQSYFDEQAGSAASDRGVPSSLRPAATV
jgi:hypothetical protein